MPLPETSNAGIVPDVSGFVEAQARLRDVLGTDVTFYVPTEIVWPAGTAIDPETGRPYDPMAEPESGGDFTEVVKRVGLVFNPVPDEAPTGADVRGGLRRDGNVAFSIDAADYPDIQGATEAETGGIRYRITGIEDDAGPDDRYIAFGEAK